MRVFRKPAFTLLEILLVVAAIGILAGIVIIAINPGRQLAATRNAARQVDVSTILNAIYQYSLDHNGQFPDGINADAGSNCLAAVAASNSYSICKTGQAVAEGGTCSGVDLDVLTENGVYLTAIPVDQSPFVSPTGELNHTGYGVFQESSGRLSVCAPNAENGEVISVTR